MAQSERPGATHVDLPEDVARAAVDASDDRPLFVQQPVAPEPAPAQVTRAARLLDGARRPLILAGHGVARGHAEGSLRRFAERLAVPVTTTFMGKGAIPASHPLHVGAIGIPGQDFIAQALAEEADLVIAVGYDLAFPMKPARVVAELRKALGPDDLVVSDVGVHKLWLGRRYPCERPNTCIISNGFAAMGIAVPDAVAAKLAFPDRAVVAATGDGGFLMNAQEIETALRVGAPFVSLVFHDDTFGLIKYEQERQFGRSSAVDFGNPDFVRFAESFGATGYRVGSAVELGPILREAISSGTVAVVDCPVDYRYNASLAE